MVAKFQIKNAINGIVLNIVNNTNTDNDYFQYETRAAQIPYPPTADQGQIWVTNRTPLDNPEGTTFFNPFSNGFLGDTGVKITQGTYTGKSLGTITFLADMFLDRFIFEKNPNFPTRFRILRFSNGAPTKQYITLNLDASDIFLLEIDTPETIPSSLSIDWYIEPIQGNIDLKTN